MWMEAVFENFLTMLSLLMSGSDLVWFCVADTLNWKYS